MPFIRKNMVGVAVLVIWTAGMIVGIGYGISSGYYDAALKALLGS